MSRAQIAALRYGEALRMRGEGLTFKEIAAAFGVGISRAFALVRMGREHHELAERRQYFRLCCEAIAE